MIQSFDQIITTYVAANKDIKDNNKWYSRAVLEVKLSPGRTAVLTTRILGPLELLIYKIIGYITEGSKLSSAANFLSINSSKLNGSHAEFVRIINEKITIHNSKSSDQIKKIILPSPEPDCNAVAPPTDECNNCEISPCGLPNFGKPILANICWMNSACQTIFRSPQLLKRLLEYGTIIDKETKKPNEKLVLLLNELIKVINQSNGMDIEGIRKIQEGMIGCYVSLDSGYRIGTQHDPHLFLTEVIKVLNLDHSVVSNDEEGRLKKPERNPYVLLAYVNGRSFEESLKVANIVATIRVIDKNTGMQKMVAIHRYLTQVPPLMMIRLNNYAHAPKSFDNFSDTLDFSHLFTEEIRLKNKNLRYKINATTNHSNPLQGKSGHYTSQEKEERRHYNDLIVSSLPVKAVLSNFGYGSHQIWELEDPSSATS